VSACSALSTVTPVIKITRALNAAPIHFLSAEYVWDVLLDAALVQTSILALFAAMAITNSRPLSVNPVQRDARFALLLPHILAPVVWQDTSSIPAIFAFPAHHPALPAILMDASPAILDFSSLEAAVFLVPIIVSLVSMPMLAASVQQVPSSTLRMLASTAPLTAKLV